MKVRNETEQRELVWQKKTTKMTHRGSGKEKIFKQ
jgi:hypothetical protein